VKTLRERLGDEADHPRWLETVRGVGYRMRERPAG
jgi:two-component system alkaline phosphatase synthesis response regulator PhoP